MLSTPTPFPQQGSKALLGRLPVRIIQPRPDGRVLVSGHIVDGRPFTRTVALAALADAAMPDHPIDRWIEERLVPNAEGEFVPADDLHTDFVGWCHDRGLSARSIPGAVALYQQLIERGYTRSTRRSHRPTGPMALPHFNVALRTPVEHA